MRRLFGLVLLWTAVGLGTGLLSASQWGGHALGFLTRVLSTLMLMPGLILGRCFFHLESLLTVPGTIFSAAATAFLGWLALLLLRGRPRGRSPEEQDRTLTRRTFLAAGASAGAGVALAGYGYTAGRHTLQLTENSLPLRGLPAELEGLRIALMADWHCGQHNSIDYLRTAMEMCNQARPDLILLPGDFVSYSAKNAAMAAELITMLRPAIPGAIFASFGNHDYWTNIEEVGAGLRQAGAHILTNSAQQLNARRELDRDARSGLWIAGVDDLWAGQPDLERALQGIPETQPRLVLCHNPDVAELQPRGRVDLMVSGHTHGGQVTLPRIGPPILPSEYGQKYARGFVKGPGYPVYVTRGVGVGGIPLRLGVPPEVSLLICRQAPVS